jgi:hypothetical protein
MAEGRARYKLIACNVFQRELCAAISEAACVIDPEFLELGLHERPESLRAALPERIDAASAPGKGAPYDAVLLGYGLCGNGTAGIEARGLPLVLARAHDCCTILLGSRSEFIARFGERLSASWSSAGYVERGSTYFRTSELGASLGNGLAYEALVHDYGEENAAYVWETLHPEATETELRFIETAETAGLGYAGAMRERAAAEGKEFVLLRGSTRLLRALLSGSWDEAEFLVVPPGMKIWPLYDHDRVFEAR